MKQEYLPKTPEGRLWHLSEECGEVIAELLNLSKQCCKMGRFGPNGDDFPSMNREIGTPRERVLAAVRKLQSEMADLNYAIATVMQDLST